MLVSRTVSADLIIIMCLAFPFVVFVLSARLLTKLVFFVAVMVFFVFVFLVFVFFVLVIFVFVFFTFALL